MRIAMLIACVGASLSCACSFIFVKGPPAAAEKLPPSEPIECTTGKAAPVIDTLIAGYQVFRTGYALSRTDADYAGAKISRNADIGFGAGLTALFVASSIYGYVTTGECSDIKAAHERRGAMPEGRSATPETFTFTPNRRQVNHSEPAAREQPTPSAAALPDAPAEAQPTPSAKAPQTAPPPEQ